jgi:hypothetical protein
MMLLNTFPTKLSNQSLNESLKIFRITQEK